MNVKESSQKHQFPPVYTRPLQEAVVRGELEQFRASHKLNAECAKAIDTALTQYADNSLYGFNAAAASKDVVDKFGFERTMTVLANTVRHYSWDGRFSNASRDWAKTMPRLDKQDACLVGTNAGCVDLFVGQVCYDYELTQPLKASEIRAEAEQVLKQFQAISEPNSPDKTKFMAKISPEFDARARPEDFVKMIKMLPFSSPRLTTLPGQKGFFAVISNKEAQHQHLRKPSIKAQLAAKPVPGDKPKERPRDTGAR